MKLLYCPECDDFVRLLKSKPRDCECGEVGGQYIDDSRAEYFGDPVPVGLHNASFLQAVLDRTDDWPGPEVMAYIIPRDTENMIKVERSDVYGSGS